MHGLDYEGLRAEREELRFRVDDAVEHGVTELDGCPVCILARQVEHMTSLLLCMSARAACEESARNAQGQQQGQQPASGMI